jgi:hypothetical protein
MSLLQDAGKIVPASFGGYPASTKYMLIFPLCFTSCFSRLNHSFSRPGIIALERSPSQAILVPSITFLKETGKSHKAICSHR